MDNRPRKIVTGLCVSEHDGGLAIFQPDTGRLFVCNRVGALIWSGLSKGLSIDEISKEIAQRFSVAPEQAMHDARDFETELESREWLSAEAGEIRNGTLMRLTIRAWIELALHDWRIFRGGFGKIHRQLMRQRVATRRRKPQSAADLCHAVNLAACFYFRRVQCLQRSAVTVRLLRMHGIDAHLVIAYRPSPFFGHSWTEVDGEIINDSPAYAEQLIVLYRSRAAEEQRKERI